MRLPFDQPGQLAGNDGETTYICTAAIASQSRIAHTLPPRSATAGNMTVSGENEIQIDEDHELYVQPAAYDMMLWGVSIDCT